MTATAPVPETIQGIPADIYNRRWIVLGVLCISLVLVVVAVSSLNVALPTIQETLGASGTQLQWILDGYALVFAGCLLLAGAVGDRWGRKGALQCGLVLFGLAAVIATLAKSAAVLIAARSLMGVGAAFIMPATLSIVINCFPFAERPKAIAVWSGFAGVGGALGPISSGLLLKWFWWGSVFFVNLPLVVLLLVLSAFLVPSSRDPEERPLDVLGAALSVVSLVSLVYAVIEGPGKGWSHPAVLGGFALAVLGGFAFVRYELAREHPMLDPRLFRLRGFSSGAASVTLVFFSMFGMFFLLTQYLQFVKLYSPLQAGVRVLPSACALLLVAPQGPKIVGRLGVRRTVRIGFSLQAVGLGILAFATYSTPYPLIALALVITATGTAMVMPCSSQHIVGALPLSKAGVGSAVNDVTREVGGALGIAVAGSIVASLYRTRAGFVDAIADPTARALARDSVGKAVSVARRGLASRQIPQSVHDAFVRQAGVAFNHGTQTALWALAGIALVAAAIVGAVIPDMLPGRAVPSHAPAPEPEPEADAATSPT